MSNQGNLNRDGIFGNLQIKGKMVLDKFRNLRVNNGKFNGDLKVKNTLTAGNTIIKGNLEVTGSINNCTNCNNFCKCDLHTYDNSCIIYVNVNAPPSGDGLSWATAFQQLQDAIDLASSTVGSSEIWMAGGTYKPTYVDPSITPFFTAGLPTWFIHNIDISIYGGFRGNETRRSDRNLGNTLYRTTLSGDLNDNDAPYTDRTDVPHNDPAGYWILPEPYLATKRDNVRHLFLTAGSNVTFDGLYLTKGWAGDDLPFINGGNVNDYIGATQGGGIFTVGSLSGNINNIVLRNVVFDDCGAYSNYVASLGGALQAINSSVLMENVVMKNCFTSDFSAGFLIVNDNNVSDADYSLYSTVMDNVTISNNKCHGCVNSFENHHVSMTNCLWQNNYSIIACGNLQILNDAAVQKTWSDLIEDCIFDGNEGGWCAALDLINTANDGVNILPTGLTRVLNSKFIDNGAVYLADPATACGAICNYSNRLWIEGCTFEGNQGISCGAICNKPAYIDAIQTKGDVYVTIRNNIFSRNQSIPGLDNSRTGPCGAICFKTEPTADFDTNNITRPNPSSWGEVTDNKFYQNHSIGNGGALCLDTFQGSVKNNKFDNDTADLQGTEIFVVQSDTNDLLNCNRFVAPVTPNTIVVAPDSLRIMSEPNTHPNMMSRGTGKISGRSANFDIKAQINKLML